LQRFELVLSGALLHVERLLEISRAHLGRLLTVPKLADLFLEAFDPPLALGSAIDASVARRSVRVERRRVSDVRRCWRLVGRGRDDPCAGSVGHAIGSGWRRCRSAIRLRIRAFHLHLLCEPAPLPILDGFEGPAGLDQLLRELVAFASELRDLGVKLFDLLKEARRIRAQLLDVPGPARRLLFPRGSRAGESRRQKNDKHSHFPRRARLHRGKSNSIAGYG
jgi:hypothetical protein